MEVQPWVLTLLEQMEQLQQLEWLVVQQLEE